jgi:hypothetical protein
MNLPTSRRALFAGARRTGTDFEVFQIASRTAQSAKSPGKYWPDDPDRRNQDAYVPAEVRPG